MNKNNKLLLFLLINVLVIIILTYATFIYYNSNLKNQEKKTITFVDFLNNGQILTFKTFFMGLIFGLIFGFIDNIGLWIGLEQMEKFLPGGFLTKAGLGNTYSNFMGSIIGTLLTIIIKTNFEYNNDSNPIWLKSIGIAFGCLLGIVVGQIITNKN